MKYKPTFDSEWLDWPHWCGPTWDDVDAHHNASTGVPVTWVSDDLETVKITFVALQWDNGVEWWSTQMPPLVRGDLPLPADPLGGATWFSVPADPTVDISCRYGKVVVDPMLWRDSPDFRAAFSRDVQITHFDRDVCLNAIVIYGNSAHFRALNQGDVAPDYRVAFDLSSRSVSFS